MILPARQSGVTEARLKRIVHVELSVRSSGDVKYDGWISSNVPPADETLELVYNRGQLHVRRESYRLLAVVQLLPARTVTLSLSILTSTLKYLKFLFGKIRIFLGI